MTPPPRSRTPLLLRGIAFAIVLAAIVDPGFERSVRSEAVVAVIPADPAPRAFPAGSDHPAEHVARALERSFRVVRGPDPGAAATVLVGDRLPSWARGVGEETGPAAFIVPDPVDGAPFRVARVDAPPRLPLGARAEVRVDLEPTGSGTRGPAPILLLRLGETVLDRVELDPSGRGRTVALSFLATSEGIQHLSVELRSGSDRRRVADLAVAVEERPYRVHFHDPRPSWPSTFVRRLLEADPRFELTGRVVTSPGLATTFGDAPPSLADPELLSGYDVVVVGAPDDLTRGDVEGLRAFLDRRGGSVVLLLDRDAAGPHQALVGGGSWRTTPGARLLAFTGDPAAASNGTGEAGLPTLSAREVTWPDPLPVGVRVLAAGPGGEPGVWSRPVGAGLLFVAGTLDAWQNRDPEQSEFETFWPRVLAGAAEAALPLVELSWGEDAPGPSGGVVRPGDPVELRILPAAGASGAAAVASGLQLHLSASLEGEGLDAPIPLPAPRPDLVPGRLRTRFFAPDRAGHYTVRVDVEGGAGELPLVVDPGRAPHPAAERAVAAAWADARGGGLHGSSAAELDRLVLRLDGLLDPARTPETWHPMRAPWWILPFALALAGEWWWRRRRGFP